MSTPVSSDRPFLNRRLAAFGTTIFAEMSALATRTGSINLGQGFPDTDGPAQIAEAASRAVLTGLGNQYPPGPGVPELRTAIAAHQQRFYGLDHDPDTEVLVTAGATEAIAASSSPSWSRATRSSPWSRTTTRTRPASPWPVRCASPSPCARTPEPSPSTWTNCAPPSPRAPACCS